MPEFYNRSAIHRHAIRISKEQRAGKFTCVSNAFIDEAIAEADADLRRMRSVFTSGLFPIIVTDEVFLTGYGRDGLAADFDTLVAKIIQKRVHATRVGKTL